MSQSIGINKLTAYYLLLFLMMFSWLFSFNPFLLNICLIVLVGLIILPFLKQQKILMKKNDVAISCIFVLFLLMNLIAFGINYDAIINLFFMFLPIAILLFFVRIKKENGEVLKFFYSDKFYNFFNFYFWINIVIIHIQNIKPGFLMIGYESHYDHITGFFGPGATHVLTVFFACLICMTLERIIRNKKFLEVFYLGALVIAMVSTIAINDNVASVFFVPFAVLLFLFNKFGFNTKLFFKLLTILSVICLVFFLIYENNENLRYFVDSRVMSKINAYFLNNNNNITNSGFGDERIRAFEFTMLYGDGAFLGKGFSCSLDDVTKLFGYKEYSGENKTYVGISDISGVTYLGGIWFYILWSFILTRLFTKITATSTEGNTFLRFLVHFFCMLFFTTYTTLFRSPNMVIILAIYGLILSNSQKRSVNK